MSRQSVCFRGSFVAMSLVLCALAAHGEDVLIKDGTRLVNSDFARNWGEDDDAEEQILNTLCERVDVDIDMTLSAFVKWLDETHGLPAELDLEAFEEENIALDTRVRLKARQLRLETVLYRALRSTKTKLSWYIDSGTLQIAPHDNDRQELRVYSIQNLLDGGLDQNKVVELLTENTSGPWQINDGEGGTIKSLPRGRILIWQSQKVHFEIARLIRRLQELD